MAIIKWFSIENKLMQNVYSPRIKNILEQTFANKGVAKANE
ncbi:hypothetical protein BSM4216_2443 [Bacillus smithii]|nr:hypothetical protein BSM4216_2443 [Bacillus smithii]